MSPRLSCRVVGVVAAVGVVLFGGIGVSQALALESSSLAWLAFPSLSPTSSAIAASGGIGSDPCAKLRNALAQARTDLKSVNIEIEETQQQIKKLTDWIGWLRFEFQVTGDQGILQQIEDASIQLEELEVKLADLVAEAEQFEIDIQELRERLSDCVSRG